jgi:hypothetical protein
VQVKNPLWIYY